MKNILNTIINLLIILTSTILSYVKKLLKLLKISELVCEMTTAQVKFYLDLLLVKQKL